MAATSPGDRLCPKAQSDIKFNALKTPQCIEKLQMLCSLVRSSFGPHGNTKVIHNNSGGHVIVTSSSSRIFSALSVKDPIIKLITTSSQSYLRTCPDGGLFATLLTLNLILKGLPLPFPPKLTSNVYEFLLSESIGLLKASPNSDDKLEFDFSSTKQIEQLVMGVIAPKRGCDLNACDIHHLSKILSQAFVSAYQVKQSTVDISLINFLTLAGRPPCETQIINGMLFSIPDIATYKKQLSNLQRDEDQSVKVALVNVSLAGDTEGTMDAEYELSEGVALEETTLILLHRLIDKLVKERVGAVLCQKVVHPMIKRRCRENRILVVERLGSQNISTLRKLTSGEYISSITPHSNLDGLFGKLSAIQHLVIGGKDYIQFQNFESSVSSIVLTNRSENSLDEMKCLCQAVLEVLRMAMSRQVCLLGGGKWQSTLARRLKERVKDIPDAELERLYVSKYQYGLISDTFCESLLDIVQCITRSKAELWDPEVDLAHKTEDVCLDLFDIAIHGLKTAVNTSCLVLNINTYISDIN